MRRARESLAALEERIARFEAAVGREGRDVARLEGGVLALLHRVLGSLEDKARAEHAVITDEIATLTERAAALVDAPERLSAARAAKEHWLRTHDEAAAQTKEPAARPRASQLRGHLEAVVEGHELG